MRKTNTHLYFWKEYLSQWHRSVFKKDNLLFPTAEHFMMYCKALLFNDHNMAEKILSAKHPREVKEYGRAVSNFRQDIWNLNKFNIVVEGNILKFTQNETLKQKLLDTKNLILVEASPFDRVWGVGLSEDDDRILDEKKWLGENLLGKALMKVRDYLRKSIDEKI